MLESPDVFQRFVTQQVASALVPPETPIGIPADFAPQNVVLPVSATESFPVVPPATTDNPLPFPPAPNNP